MTEKPTEKPVPMSDSSGLPVQEAAPAEAADTEASYTETGHAEAAPTEAAPAETYTEYDAFISYKHGPVDSAVAKRLQQKLEHFQEPILARGLFHRKSERRIRRVFLDDGELSACAAFASHIRQALEHSRWLIIICSPETRTSPWVNLEIETFLEFHDRSHILAVMTSGEPLDIFPQAFIGASGIPDEMLAADARGENLREVLHKLSGDVLLRVAAPLLDLDYDDLKQRHRVYRLQRFMLAAVACLAAISCFLVYAFIQNRNLTRINRNLTLRQSEVLTKEATDLLEEGDNLQAVQYLLEALPDPENEDRKNIPVLPQAQYALTDALNLYRPELTPNYGTTHLAPSALIHPEDPLNSCIFTDPEGKYLFGNSWNHIYVWSTASNKLLRTFTFDQVLQYWAPDMILDNQRMVVCEQNFVTCHDYVTGEIIWRTSIANEIDAAVCSKAGAAPDNEESASEAPASEESAADSRKMFLLTGNNVSVIDLSDGTLVSDLPLHAEAAGTDEEPGESDGSAVSTEEYLDRVKLSESGRLLLIASHLSGEEAVSYFLRVCDPLTGEVLQTITDKNENGDAEYSFHDFALLDQPGEESLLLYSYQTEKTGEVPAESTKTSHLTTVETPDESTKTSHQTTGETPDESTKTNHLTAVSMKTKAVKWQKDYPSAYVMDSDSSSQYIGSDHGEEQIHFLTLGNTKTQVLYACHTHVFVLRPEDGREEDEWQVTGDVRTSMLSDDYYFVLTQKGHLYAYNGESVLLLSSAFPSRYEDIIHSSKSSDFYCLQDSGTIRKYSPAEPDGNYDTLTQTEESLQGNQIWQNEDWIVIQTGTENMCWINSKDNTFFSASIPEIIKAALPEKEATEEEEISSYDAWIQYLEKDTICICCLREAEAEGDSPCVECHRILYDLADQTASGDILFRTDYYQYLEMDHFCWCPQTRTLYVIDSIRSGLIFYAFSSDGKKMEKHTFVLDHPYQYHPYQYKCYFSPDGKSILLIEKEKQSAYILSADTWKLRARIDLSGFREEPIDKLTASSGLFDHTDSCRLAWNEKHLALFDGTRIRVYDREGRETMSFPVPQTSALTEEDIQPLMVFSPDGHYLYSLFSDTLTQYSMTESAVTNKILLPTDQTDIHSDRHYTCLFYFGDDQSGRTGNRGTNMLRIVNDNGFYAVRIDEQAFGVTTYVKDAFMYEPGTQKIYLSRYDPGSSAYDCLFYREYALEEIIEYARTACMKQEMTTP
ncbi:MAG: TIR domain-containing protein [Sarcina sp.]|nr:TIR domain-containing protein [Sarcina sp.]